MNFNIRVHDRFTIIDFPDDEINFIKATAIKSKLKTLIKQGHSSIIINLAKVDYIDSTALSVLVSIQKMCLENNGELRICCPNNEVEMIFYLTGIDKIVSIFYSEAEAVAYVNPDKLYMNL